MAGRDELVYDEDDYVPPGYVPPKRAGNRTKQFVVVAIVGVLVGAVLLMYVMRSRERTRFVQVERVRAGQNAILAANQRAARLPTGTATGAAENWDRIIGVWSRVADPENRDNYPVRFDIRPDQSATITFLDLEGQVMSREWQVRVFTEANDNITLEFHDIRTPPQVDHQQFRFTIREDGTVLLFDTMDGIIFTREK